MTHDLGKYIRTLRKERRLKLVDVGRACNRSAAFICDIEKGVRGKRPNPEMLIQLAEYFNVPVTSMLEKGGLVVEEKSESYKLYLKVTRNKVKSMRIVNAFTVINELIMELETVVVEYPAARRVTNSLMNSIRELESAILHGR
jgi:transcriptional regulator with XRE-family HTH domain